jgi:hypothetical protein
MVIQQPKQVVENISVRRVAFHSIAQSDAAAAPRSTTSRRLYTRIPSSPRPCRSSRRPRPPPRPRPRSRSRSRCSRSASAWVSPLSLTRRRGPAPPLYYPCLFPYIPFVCQYNPLTLFREDTVSIQRGLWDSVHTSSAFRRCLARAGMEGGGDDKRWEERRILDRGEEEGERDGYGAGSIVCVFL